MHYHKGHKTTPQQVLAVEGSSYLWDGVGDRRLVTDLFQTVEPFAYVISDYTCQDGQNKRTDAVHKRHLLSVTGLRPRKDGNSTIIPDI